MDRRDRPFVAALAASIAAHIALLALPGPATKPPTAPPPVTVLASRIDAAAERAVARPKAPPEVLKNTFDPPQAKPLEDPIKPQPRRRIADKAAKAPEPARRPAAPQVAPPKPPEPAPPLGRGLDLRVPAEPRAERLTPDALRETLNRLSEELLYPADALQRGLEGEVVILVELGAEGRILDASIATGSGHRSLDDAAVRAVKKLGTLGPSSAHKTILLPVRFRIL
jgi:protein TonB